MKKSFKLILFGCVLFGVSQFAAAREWSFLNYQNGTCKVEGTSPADMDDYLRSKGMTPNIEKFNNNKNELERVDIQFNQLNGTGIVLRFFTTKDACANFRLKEIENGNIIDKDDLR